jgi:hypothetical protein
MCATAAVGDGATLQPGVDDHGDTALAKLLGWPDAQVHEDLRAMDAAGRLHNLAGRDPPQALVHELDANGPLVLDEDANDGLVGRVDVRTQISVDRAAPPLISDRRRFAIRLISCVINADTKITEEIGTEIPHEHDPLCG